MSLGRASRSSPPVSLLRNGNFVLLWCAYAISAMGDHLSEMAILKTQNALEQTVDITALAARISFTFFLPFFLLSPWAGVLADRLPRRGVMVCADLARFGVMLILGALIAWTSDWGTWGPFLPLMFVGVFAAMFSPARSALLSTLIRPDQFVRANGLIGGLGIIATMAAGYLGGLLADRYAPTVAFRLDAVTFLASAAFLMFIRPPKQPSEAADRMTVGRVTAQLRGGFHYVRSHRHVVELIAIAAIVWFCGSLVNSVIPAVVRDVYDGSYTTISVFRALLGLGFILGAIVITTLGDALRSEIAMTWGLMGIAVGMAIFAASVFARPRVDHPLLSGDQARVFGAVGVVCGGFFAMCTMASFNSLLQRTVANRYRGRVFGVKDLCTTGALLVAAGLLGVQSWFRIDPWVGHILLGVALIAMGAGLVTLVVRLRRTDFGKRLTFVENLNEFTARFWWRFQRVGRATVPRTGPVIVTANHRCPADPQLLGAAVRYRAIAFMVAAEYTSIPIAGYVMRLFECIPVRRGSRDTGATKTALRRLRAGKALGIFIEGRIVPPGEPASPKDGVAMLALKTGATVIPAYISGTRYRKGIFRGLLARHRARVRFGPPVDLTEFAAMDKNRQTLSAATDKIYAAIMALAPTDAPETHHGDSTRSARPPITERTQ